MTARRACLMGLLAGVLAACPGGPPAGEAPNRAEATQEARAPEPRPDRRPVVVFETAGGPVEVRVELAATASMRAKGLMGREHLPEGDGMLFVFPASRDLTFWMKDTLIPLDMVFISEALEVVGVVANAEPETLTRRSIGKPSRYVVEVPGGWAAAQGIREGVKVRLPL